MTPDEALLRDALEHIAKVACEGVRNTRRLDWIATRAAVALRGEAWIRGHRDDPENSVLKLTKENERLRRRLADLEGSRRLALYP